MSRPSTSFSLKSSQDVDARHKPAHDELNRMRRGLEVKDTTADETSARYEGWRVVAACFVIAIFGWGLCFYGQSVFLAELHRIHGWPTSLISTATTFFYLFSAVLVA